MLPWLVIPWTLNHHVTLLCCKTTYRPVNEAEEFTWDFFSPSHQNLALLEIPTYSAGLFLKWIQFYCKRFSLKKVQLILPKPLSFAFFSLSAIEYFTLVTAKFKAISYRHNKYSSWSAWSPSTIRWEPNFYFILSLSQTSESKRLAVSSVKNVRAKCWWDIRRELFGAIVTRILRKYCQQLKSHIHIGKWIVRLEIKS